MRRPLIVCGLLASLVWVGNDLFGGMLWQAYSYVDQAISELSAVGAPTRSLVFSVLLVYDGLVIAFGVGIFTLTQQRALRPT